MYPVAFYKLIGNPVLWNSILISIVWGSYNFLLLLLCLGVVWERKQIRKTHRINVQEAVEVILLNKDEEIPPLSGHTTDISEEGMSILLDNVADIPEGSHVDIKTTDLSGKSFTLWAKILRSFEHNGQQVLGCQFQYADELSFYNTTDYIYGDSNRWDLFWKNRQKDISLGKGIVYVFKLGISGTFRHMKGLVLQALEKLTTTHQEGICNRIRVFFTNQAK